VKNDVSKPDSLHYAGN